MKRKDFTQACFTTINKALAHFTEATLAIPQKNWLISQKSGDLRRMPHFNEASVTTMKVPDLFTKGNFNCHITGVQPWRKQDFHGSAGDTFLCNYCALPCQQQCCHSVIPSRQFLYMHTFIRIL
jgi:hypothetical protein